MHLTHQPNATSPFQALPNASPSAAASDSTSSADSSSSSNSATSTATITANDFLQLLVTELQNQDPTANTDPNEYVDQLVQVNTLQQQIQMNQTLDGGPTLTGASSGVLQELVQMNDLLSGGSSTASAARPVGAASTSAGAEAKTEGHASAGNLSPTSDPAMQASAEAVATALTANPHTAGTGQGLTDMIPESQEGAFAQFAARLRANPPAQP